MKTKRKHLLLLLSASLPLALSGCNRSNPETTVTSRQDTVQSDAKGVSDLPASSTNAGPDSTRVNQPKLLVQDTFQENNYPDSFRNMEIPGVKPSPTNVPGAKWQLVSGDGSYETYLTPPSTTAAACFHHIGSVGLSLASNGAYVKPTVISISADLAFASDMPYGYCLLGFYSALPKGKNIDPTLAFTGLMLKKDGTLQLLENGKPAPNPIKYGGSYDSKLPVTLSYSIDTAKGTIFHIVLSGSTSTYDMTSSAFTDSATALVGIGGMTDDQSFCYMNNLQISSGIAPPQKSTETNPANAPADSTQAQTNSP